MNELLSRFNDKIIIGDTYAKAFCRAT